MNLRYNGGTPEKEVFEVINETLDDLISNDDRVAYIDSDLMGALKTKNLWQKYPNNVFNTGIQEANMVGLACGMFLNGFKPYIHSFTPFVSRRVFDQLFVSGAYGHKSIRVIGSDVGIMATKNGGTHMCFEDVAMMRSIPEACIVDVSDPVMCGAMLRLTKDRAGISYIRTPRRDLPDIYQPEEEFMIGKAKMLKDGQDVTIVASGIMVSTALQAAEKLAAKGISARVVDIVTIKPIDEEMLLKCAQETQGIITVENANILGGLGSAVSEFLAENYPARVVKIGINDKFGCVGDEKFLREKYGLTAENIIEKVEAVMEGK